MSAPKNYDSNNVAIFCRFCKARRITYNHHPNSCKRCFICAELGHNESKCPRNEIKSKRLNRSYKSRVVSEFSAGISPRRMAVMDNVKEFAETETVSLDVEKVQGLNNEQNPGWVVLYCSPTKKYRNMNKIVYSAKITQLRDNVRSYATRWSGLSALDLSEESVPLAEVTKRLKEILPNRVVVGIGLEQDLVCLGVADVVPVDKRFEFKDYFKDDADQPIGLKQLAYAFLGRRIQEFDPTHDAITGHSPVKDCRATIDIYQRKDRPGNGPIDGSFQWVRNLVDEARESGHIKLDK